MRIFQAFLVLVISVLLFMLPLSETIRDFRTYVKEDTFASVATGAGETTANVTIQKALYDNDTSSFAISSSISADVPVFSSYNGTIRALQTGGLSANTTRALTVSYDVDALTGYTALSALMDRVPFFWLLLVLIFPIVGLAAIFTGRV